jgi:DNA repair photolyase
MLSNKEFKSPLKLPSSGYELVTCHYPLRLDVYSGCEHDCVYCYAKKILTSRGLWHPEAIRVADIKKIEYEFEKAFSGRGKSPISEALRHKLPVRLGGMTDCFMPYEEEAGATLKLLKVLNKYDYPYLIVTKGVILSKKPYIELIAAGKACVQVTIISLDWSRVKRIEPHAPSIRRRLTSMKKLANRGIWVCGRLSPVVPELSTRNIERYVKTMADIGVRHIQAEFFRGNRPMIKTVENLARIEFMDIMVPHGTYYRASISYKNEFYTKMSDLCRKHKLEFTVCSDGDGVPREFNTTNVCCGTDNIPGFDGCSMCVANMVGHEVDKKGTVTLKQMEKKYWTPGVKQFEEMWENGRIEDLVDGVKKSKKGYQII